MIHYIYHNVYLFRFLMRCGVNVIRMFYHMIDYETMKLRIKVGHVFNPDYSKLIQNAKVALCLFSKGNLDTITARSIEIPAIGSLLCAKRTKTHKKVFAENKEAIFFKDAKECVQKCKKLLKCVCLKVH